MAKRIEDAPLHPDKIARMDNVNMQKMPEAIKIEALQRELSLSTLDKRKINYRDIEPAESSGANHLSFDLENHIVEGLLGENLEQIEVQAPGKYESPSKPKSPEWAGRIFHPRVAVREFNPVMQRRNGKTIQPNKVVGRDDRRLYYPIGYPWHCIGRVYVWNDASATFPSWTGSGALVGSNVVLTASHVVPWGAKSWKMKFVPAHYDGSSIYGPGMEAWVISARGYRNTSNVTGWDIATLRLTRSLGNSLGYFGTKHYSASWNDEPYWTHCGYAGAVSGTRPNWQNGISVHDTDSDSPGLEIEHDGDVTPGDSGGPLFAWWSEGPYVVGTHSGEETEYHFPFSFPRVNVDAGGGALNSLVRWARDNW